MSTKTKPSMSLRALARQLKVSHTALRQARDAGRVHLVEPFDVEAIRAEWIATTRSMGPSPLADRAEASPAPAPVDAREVESFADARRRKETALADLREMDRARKGGELCLASVVEAGLVDVLRSARDQLLALPSRLREAAPHLAHNDAETVDRLLREALSDLASPRAEDTAKQITGDAVAAARVSA